MPYLPLKKIIKQTTETQFVKFSAGFPNNVNFSKIFDRSTFFENNLICPV